MITPINGFLFENSKCNQVNCWGLKPAKLITNRIQRGLLLITLLLTLSLVSTIIADQLREIVISVRSECCPAAVRVNNVFGNQLAMIFGIPDEKKQAGPQKETPNQEGKKTKQGSTKKWNSLFDGKSLEGWKVAKFGGEGDVQVKDGAISIGAGVLVSGATISDPKRIPRTNFEVEYEGMRADGDDFFAALTFPFGDQCCTFVPSGWTGTVTGLSIIDGKDASENDTTIDYDFENGKWYKFRVRVTDHSIQCWVGKKRIVAQAVFEEKVDIRPEMELSKPFGFATFQTDGLIKNIRLRTLSKPEIAKANKLREELKAEELKAEKSKSEK